MQITLTSKEFDEAVSLWLKEQGFTTDRYDIATRVIVGRGDSGAGTRVEVTLEPCAEVPSQLFTAMSLGDIPPPPRLAHKGTDSTWEQAYVESTRPPKRFGQGHADE